MTAPVPAEAVDAAVDSVLADLTAELHARGIIPAIDREWLAGAITRAVGAAAPHIREAGIHEGVRLERQRTEDATTLTGYVKHIEHRVTELEQLGDDILSRFTRTDDGHRARVGQVQIAKWQTVLKGQQSA